MAKEESILKEKLRAYKNKYYLNQAIRGIIFVCAIFLSMYLLFTSLDFGFRPGTLGRSIIFFSFIFLSISSLCWFVFLPLSKIYLGKNQMSDEDAARQIGMLFPELKDKLLNTIQLSNIDNQDNMLIAASLNARISTISIFQFTNGIKISANRKYIRYVAYPAGVLFILFLFVPQFLTESTVRIIRYNDEFKPSSYFSFTPIQNKEFAFKNENYKIQFKLEGSLVPENVYVRLRNRKIKMNWSSDKTIVSHEFKKIQTDFNYSLEATDFNSEPYKVQVFSRPDIKNFNVELQYPPYTLRENETLANSGNLNIPEGTEVKWLINSISSDSLFFSFSPNQTPNHSYNIDNQLFSFEKTFFESQDYTISLLNDYSQNKDEIKYHIEVNQDQFPSLSLNVHQDTTLFSYLILGGNVSDDYGISKLELVYHTNINGRPSNEKTISIPTGKSFKSQNYFYQWILDSLSLIEGDNLEYHLRAWDNDQINGAKFTKSASYNFRIPNKEEIREDLEKQAEGAKDQLGKTLEEAEELKEQIEDIQEKLKSKKELDWQDKKQIEELLKQKEKLQKELEELKEKNKSFAQKKERFSEQSDKLKEKVQQLQKLMDDLLDEETKKLYEELKKLLEEQKGLDQVQDMMDQIENKEDNMEKEIERTLELFKKMQFDYKMEDIVNELEELEKNQKDLSEETQNKSSDLEELKEKQQELNEEFDKVREDLEELEELNSELKNPEELEDTSEDEENIENEQDKSSEQLNNKQRKKASDSQKNASENIEKLKKKMQQMQSNMEMVMLEENIDNLEDIVDNLVKVSFDQEKIMQEFRGVNQSDPRYISLSQRQLKLRDDSKIIEDSLLSLAGRVFQIASFVTRELDAMNDNIEESLQALKDRKLSVAVSKQQFSMTSVNNLALLLDDILQQMQQQMSDAMGKPKKGSKGKKQQIPGLSELQKQLNKKIEDLKKGGKSGRQLSEELAKLAAQQEMIRRQLQEMEELLNKPGNKDGGNGAKDAIKKMQQTEMDLVNKRITRETIQRQKDILTRLLKAEDALRERELDKERESEKADELNKQIPPKFEEYLKVKEKEVEFLKTIPLKLNPYYKEEVNKYFKRLSEQ